MAAFDTMAIKYEEVPNMRNAIEKYTTEVEDHLNKIKGYEINAGDGVYGEAQIKTVDSYIDETATQINAIVRHFDEFKDALNEVQAAYESKQAAISVSEVQNAPADAGDLIHVNKMD